MWQPHRKIYSICLVLVDNTLGSWSVFNYSVIAVTLVMVAFSSCARILGECSTVHSPPALFLKVELSLRRRIPLLCQDQSSVAQRTEMTVTKCSLMSCVWGRLMIGSQTMPTQGHSQPTPTLLDQGCVCLGVTCYLHFWQNDQDLLCATAVIRGWNGHQNMSQHTKLTLEMKILSPLLPRFELATFRSQVRCSNQQAILAPTLTLSHWMTIKHSMHPFVWYCLCVSLSHCVLISLCVMVRVRFRATHSKI